LESGATNFITNKVFDDNSIFGTDFQYSRSEVMLTIFNNNLGNLSYLGGKFYRKYVKQTLQALRLFSVAQIRETLSNSSLNQIIKSLFVEFGIMLE
jgi:hypothetical protein